MTDLKVMATGLGAGILLDALVDRGRCWCPSLVGVLGRWNWYLPSWLANVLVVREPKPVAMDVPPVVEPVLVGAGSKG